MRRPIRIARCNHSLCRITIQHLEESAKGINALYTKDDIDEVLPIIIQDKDARASYYVCPMCSCSGPAASWDEYPKVEHLIRAAQFWNEIMGSEK